MSASPITPIAVAPSEATPRVRVYRAALADERGKIILTALGAWVLAHITIAVVNVLIDKYLSLAGLSRPNPPDAPVWFSYLDLQIGVRAFESIRGSFLISAAWQMGAYLLMLAALVILLTQRLRIIAVLFPPILLTVAAFLQCLAYNAYHSYWAEGNPLLTLALMIACLAVTWSIAPRNSGWRDLRAMAREFARDLVRNPGAQFFGPIFAKEVRVVGRRRGTYWLRFLYPLGLLGLVTLVYTSATANITQYSSGAERIQRLQEVAPTLALFIAWAQYVMLHFLAAAFTAPAICDERRTRTLASLMTTPMSAAQIVMGKLSSRLVQILIMGLISVPFLLSIRVFGGLEAGVIIALVAITISSVFFMSALGILASVWSRKPASAIAMAILFYIIFTIGPVVAVVVWTMRSRAGPPDEIFAFSAPMAMVGATFYITGGGPTIVLREMWIANSVVNICLGITTLFVAAVSLRGVMLSEKALEAPARKVRRKKRRRTAATPATAGEHAEAETAPAEPSSEIIVDRETTVPDQPILWRELRQPAIGSRRMMIVIACVIAAVVLWIYSEVGPRREQPHMIVGIVGMLFLVIQAAIVSTPTITSEKDSSTWQTLLATPLTAAQILVPKLVGSVKKLWFVAAVIGAELFIGMLAGKVNPVVVMHLLMIILSVGVFLGGTGILFSLVTRRTSSAGLFNLLLAGGLWIGIPILMELANEFLLGPQGGKLQGLEDAAHCINPMVMSIVAIQGAMRDRPNWNMELPSGTDLNLFEYTAILTAVAALGLAIGMGSIWFACTRFNRLSGRTS